MSKRHESDRRMCKIKIIDSGEYIKSVPKSFAPHPPSHPPSLVAPSALPTPPLTLAPPPSSLPPPPENAAVTHTHLATQQKTTKESEDTQEQAALDKGIQKIVVHPSKAIAQIPKIVAHIPKTVVHVPKITKHTSKKNTQEKDSKITIAQPKGIQKGNEKGRDIGKNAVPKNSKQAKVVIATPTSDHSGESNGKKNIIIPTKKNRPQELAKVKITPAKLQSDEDESEVIPSKIGRAKIPSPPRNVRFAIGESRRTFSTTSSSSTSSQDSFIDIFPHQISTNRDFTHKQTKATFTGMNASHAFPGNMEEIDSSESDISSNIDAGDSFGTTIPWGETEMFSHPGPMTSQLHDQGHGPSILNRSAASPVSHAAYHEPMANFTQPEPNKPYRPLPNQEGETTSDQGSAIECTEFNQIPTIDRTDRDANSWDWMQTQSGHMDSGFSAWLKSLAHSPQARNSSQTKSFVQSFEEPILVYRSKGKRLGKKEPSPLLALQKKRIQFHKNSHDGQSQNEVKKLEESEPEYTAGNLSNRSPSVVDKGNDPVQYDPGLQIHWRDI